MKYDKDSVQVFLDGVNVNFDGCEEIKPDLTNSEKVKELIHESIERSFNASNQMDFKQSIEQQFKSWFGDDVLDHIDVAILQIRDNKVEYELVSKTHRGAKIVDEVCYIAE
ncbi:hypothetical protein [Desertibacillus haloalkaliphilus]|uniref:hypothetical protein n=1 Tax=Desertibacillus haloalkaliphilus TaxID=1328930 RepID=UPI001C26527F|nr:hypothetical protein [Desertibacillus haloalkaliphilus]MBU8908473.1 hypothetical protein [Desertibacillus haloalkaliphilus]